ncbi:MAG: alpha/beta fold hydrolase [Spirochaetales bacterium]|nr:MAG: alpha/beta fold hydrolase [Spirochaetales bacterium]
MKRTSSLFLLVVMVLAALPLAAQSVERTAHTVTSGRARLEAELVMPVGGADIKGAVVFVVGSGTGSFQDYIPGFEEQLIESIYLPRDMAVFYFNKRGVGESTGNWKWGSMERRADDALAAVEYLRTLPEIDPDGIGLIGHSQGGWIVQLAGSQDPRIAHVVSLAGPAVTVVEHDLRRVEIDLRCEGCAEADIARGVAKRARGLRVKIFVGSWFPFFEMRLTRNLFRYDPTDALKSLSQPTLLAYGTLDNMAPSADSRQRLDEIFPGGDPANITFYAAESTDHFFRITESICPDFFSADDEWLNKPYSEDFRTYLGSWLDTVLAGTR